MADRFDFDFIVIGSGFGGSVSACRLAEKGYRVGVMEMGRRYRQEDFPETNWDVRRFLWSPAAGLYGCFRMKLFRHVWVLSGIGVGGGSLVYGNTLLVPPERAWEDPQWADLNDWTSVMPRHYDTAQRMLGVVDNPCEGVADRLLREAAEREGCGETYHPTRVAVYFGERERTVPDPFFGGAGPERTGCALRGGCMTGCRYGAKNTLDKNYLHFAEQRGARIFDETRVVDVRPLGGQADGGDGYAVRTVRTTRWFSRQARTFRCRGVVFSAGVLGTLRLLMELKERGSLPRLSDRLGHVVRTNSESIIGVRLRDRELDVSEGIAIGSGIRLDEHTHVEAVRYANGCDLMGATATMLPGGEPGIGRLAALCKGILRRPLAFLRASNPFGFARSTVILLVMQTLESRIRMRLRRSWLPPFRKGLQTEGDPIPTFIPQANAFARRMADRLGGTPITAWTEILLNVPTTAHILGGATMGRDARDGVVDAWSRVFHYRNLYVCDGSVISANLGVNPSLTIAALTEHAMEHVPDAT